MLREGFKMSSNEGQDELEEVQADLRRKDDEVIIKFFLQIAKKLIWQTTFFMLFYDLVIVYKGDAIAK